MADMLKITTPLVDRVPNNTTSATNVMGTRSLDPTAPFNLSDVTRVIQTHDASEILQQNTGFIPSENETPKILADLLQDPAVTASMIRSISMLQELISLVPASNAALTQEIEQLFTALLLAPEDIAAELMRQEDSTTMFKGQLFDQLRDILAQNQGRSDVATGVGVLLKALHASVSKNDVLDSVASNLTFLANSVQSSPSLYDKLTSIIDSLRAPGAAQQFPQLKEQVLEVLNQVQNSVLFSSSMEKTIPLVVYNLSRYNDNETFLPDALNLLLSSLDSPAQKEELVGNLNGFLDKLFPGEAEKAEAALLQAGNDPVALPGEAGAARTDEELMRMAMPYLMATELNAQSLSARAVDDESQVIDALAKIITKQAKSEEISLMSGDKVEKVIHSLLASPSNFTPLLHFVVPVEMGDIRAFAEFWVDPNAVDETDDDGKRKKKQQEGDNTHMLMVFDVEGVGRFESELYVQGKRIALNLLCPPAYMDEFKDLGPSIRKAVANTGYSFETINIGRMERTHSLMEVFSDLPYKRTGIDVKI